MNLEKNEKDALNSIQRFHADAFAKFMKGAEEHGGTMADKGIEGLLREAKNEVIDQWFYLDALEQLLKCELRAGRGGQKQE